MRVSNNSDRIRIKHLSGLPEFADNPFVGRIFELHDEDKDGVINHEVSSLGRLWRKCGVEGQ